MDPRLPRIGPAATPAGANGDASAGKPKRPRRNRVKVTLTKVEEFRVEALRQDHEYLDTSTAVRRAVLVGLKTLGF